MSRFSRLALLLPLLLSACARNSLLRSPEPFQALPQGSSLEAKTEYLKSSQVKVLGPNHLQVAGQDYDDVEILRYYDNARSGDASADELKAISSVAMAEELAFDGSFYPSLGVALAVGAIDYAQAGWNATLNNNFVQGALVGWIWGSLIGTAIGWSLFAWERHDAENFNQEGSAEFSHWAGTELQLQVPTGTKAGGAALKWNY